MSYHRDGPSTMHFWSSSPTLMRTRSQVSEPSTCALPSKRQTHPRLIVSCHECAYADETAASDPPNTWVPKHIIPFICHGPIAGARGILDWGMPVRSGPSMKPNGKRSTPPITPLRTSADESSSCGRSSSDGTTNDASASDMEADPRQVIGSHTLPTAGNSRLV